MVEVAAFADTASQGSTRTETTDEKKAAKRSNPKTTRVLLEELYGDWQYLGRILSEEGEL